MSFHVALTALARLAFGSPITPVRRPDGPSNSTALIERQYECMSTVSVTSLVGMGTRTRASSCSEAETSGTSYSVDFSVTGLISEWISGGFDVGMSVETSDQQTCVGLAGQSVCLWQSIAHTAVSNHRLFPLFGAKHFGVLMNYDHNVCGVDTAQGNPVVVTSPNLDQEGTQYCVIGSCRTQGEAYWADS
ncbi:hypothetical protein LTR53_010177 [Teratosphaeriaceae sp. CCFEE 6253]|nr:hypothetical protein LTR53_010177 [Teratosphaeriaceae sp. CCFEE 6253]